MNAKPAKLAEGKAEARAAKIATESTKTKR